MSHHDHYQSDTTTAALRSIAQALEKLSGARPAPARGAEEAGASSGTGKPAIGAIEAHGQAIREAAGDIRNGLECIAHALDRIADAIGTSR